MNSPERPDQSPPTDRLAQLREEMNLATVQFILAFNRRGAIALAIAEEKRQRGIDQIRDLDREQAVLDYSELVNQGPFSGEAVKRVVQVAMDASSELQASATNIPIEESVQ